MRASMDAPSARRSAAPDPGAAPKKPRLLAPPPSRDPRSSYAAAANGARASADAAAAAAAAEQQAQVDELVAQYRTALGELTFNSKPIITNLTIIAGENLHATRAIAALVCNNILEVPSDQKLPSLYLLDSIVKNIGKDYIKHFSARLPEVFCKAYKQVDPPVHSSMRHLFGTWKGVFSPASLQMIEKELGFQSSTNGSSGSAASKPDSQSQRPSHSIHVNPKYLEARQQLQQPNKGLLGAGAKTAIISDSDDDMDRVNTIAIDKGAGRRLDNLNSRPRAQRDPFISNPIHEKPDRDIRGLGFSSISQQPVVGAGQVRSKSKGQDGIGGSYYTGGVSSSEEQFDRRSNFYANKDARPPGSDRFAAALLPTPVSTSDRTGGLSANKSWKNSEEEEYMWDDVHSQGASSARKGELMAEDGNISSFHRAKWSELGDHLDPDFRKQDTIPRFGHETGQDRRIAAYMDREEYLQSKRELEPRIDREMWPEGQQFPDSRVSSLWSPQEKTRPDIVRDPRISRFSNQSASITSSVPVGLSGAYAGRSSLESATSGPTTFGQQKHKHWSPSPPPVQAPSSTASFARQSSPSSVEHDMYASRPSFLLSQNPLEEHNQRAHALSQGATHAQGRPNLQATPPHTSSQTQKHPSVLSKPHLKPPNHLFPQDSSSSSLFRPSVHLPPEEVPLPSDPAHVNSDQVSASNLLAGLLKSGFKPNTGDHASSRAQPPLPFVMSCLPAASASENATLKPHVPNSVRPPLPPGPPPTQKADNPAPLSSLLSSLVAKGLISSPSTDSSAAVPGKPSKSSPSTSGVSASAPPLQIVQPSVGKEKSTPKKTLLPQPVEIKTTDLIGLEFMPALLREFNTHVVDSLFDDQCHQCKTCGLRFRLEEDLSEHAASHESGSSEPRNTGIAPERWYPNKKRWIDRSPEPQDIFLDSDTELCSAEEGCEFMVPADESQIICALCGEQFEDTYSIDKGEWMYKGAVYYDYSKVESNRGGVVKSQDHAPIVHGRCMPRIADDGMEED
ncbi:hypothetical protein QYE76_006899 [Lolium multiflorum]|uniref:CID domain-containing protein n=1 Tax=Lolium multiflorum TaxID=4521 RepID=A0AAD8W3R9_LOLMU|nr:hypothetical protein QYE76_006899 [Lolium multiflorum]